MPWQVRLPELQRAHDGLHTPFATLGDAAVPQRPEPFHYGALTTFGQQQQHVVWHDPY